MGSFSESIAGTIGGVAGIVTGQPLDTLKVRMQAAPERYKSSLSTMKSIVRNEGQIFALYKGTLSPLYGVAVNNAIVFGVYGNTLRMLMGHKYDNWPTSNVEATAPLYDIFAAGFVAGICSTVITSPTELVKIRLQMQEQHVSLFHSDKAQYTGTLNCLKQAWKADGFSGVFRGIGITAMRDTYSYGVYFASYEYIRRWTSQNYGSKWYSHPLTLLFGGGLAGILSWVVCYPFDVVKSRVQASPVKPPSKGSKIKYYANARQCFVKSYKEEGLGIFFKGFGPTVVRAFPVHAVTLGVYTLMMDCMH
jgi:solute carrier family 25 carnitine/acylcarnitine transporter 20/29